MKFKKLLQPFRWLVEKILSIIGRIRLLTYHHFQRSLLVTQKHVVTLSKRSKLNLIRLYEIDNKKIKIIPCGIDLNKFHTQNYSNDIRGKYGNKIILFSGLMIKRKNIPTLLRAMKYVIKELPDVQLVLTGKGPLLEPHKHLSNSLNIQNNTIFTGFISDKKLAKYYATSDIFVFPSELEGFGQVIIEALASGTPVICSNVPPMSNIVKSAGLTFNPSHPEDLSEKIIRLFKNKELYKELESNTLKVASKYDWSNIAKEYENYLKKVIDQ